MMGSQRASLTIVFCVVLLLVLPLVPSSPFATLHGATVKASPIERGAPLASPPSEVSAPVAPHDTGVGLCGNKTNSKTFYNDFTVAFSPYQINNVSLPAVSVSQFATKIVLTLTVTPGANASGVSIVQALLTVWATGWLGAKSYIPPNVTATWTLPVTKGMQAVGILNDEKYFPPGDHVYFNLTVVTSQGTVASPCPIGTDPTWSQTDQPTWQYVVAGGWVSKAFLSDIKLTAFPNILGGVFPGPYQPVTFTMVSLAGSGTPIGGANIYINVSYTNILTGNTSTFSGSQGFKPSNSTTTSVNVGPYYSKGNRTAINFYILAWELWSGGAVNYIKSPSYSYNVTNGQLWCNANQGFAHFIRLTTSPYRVNTTSPGNLSTPIPAFTIVNITIGTVAPNATINYAYVYYNETYLGHHSPGNVPMNRYNATTQYTGNGFGNPFNPSLMGPYPPGINITFSVEAFDTMDCAITSPTYFFHTAPGPPPIVNHKTFFYVVAFDDGQGTYAAGANVSIHLLNSQWYDNTTTNLLGFAYPTIPGTNVPEYLSLNTSYYIKVTYHGQMDSINYNLTANSNRTLLFHFNTLSTTQVVYAMSAPPFGWNILGGIIAASVVLFPIYFIWQEIRRKAEEEEKRITL